jgi:hypothetical protein
MILTGGGRAMKKLIVVVLVAAAAAWAYRTWAASQSGAAWDEVTDEVA